MRCLALTLSAVALELSLVHAQAPTPRGRANATPPAATELAIRRVVLYKNGVGYFEHVGRVRDSQPVNIDFTSAQLDDVLKSLTTIDLGNGRISGVSYNSEKPVTERLGVLSFAGQEPGTMSALLGGLPGARLEVRNGPRVVSGRLLGVDFAARGVEAEAFRRDEISVVSDAGTIETVALTPSTRVRLVEADTAASVGAYLNVLASTRAPDRRRLTIAATGAGERDLLVSYISEVPIWKTTYRVVLASDHAPLLQGWAIVDNTTGTDWTNVDLSLVAGAPQSFIQQISQPQYGRRNIVAPKAGTQPLPQTHDATLETSTARLGPASASGTGGGAYRPEAGGVVGGVTGGIVGGLAAPPPPPAPMSMPARLQEQVVAATGNDLADMFEYRVGSATSIRSGQSSLVPIVNAPIDVDRVTWWNGAAGARPLRAMWITNTTGLTLDGGSFMVLDGATFAGEGLVDPLKPKERRLLSYAFDLGVQIEVRQPESPAIVRRIVAQRGVATEHKEQRARRVYTVRNNDTTPRRVIVEHPRRNGWTLASQAQPIETTTTAYRFAIDVPPAQTASLTVDETQGTQVRYQLTSLNDDQIRLLIDDSGNNEQLRRALAAIRASQAEASATSIKIAEVNITIEQETRAQDRLRQNLVALKGSSEGRALTRQYAADLVATETRIRDGEQQRRQLQRTLDAVNSEARQLLEQLALDITVGAGG